MCGRLTFLMFLIFAASAHNCFRVQAAVDDNQLQEQINRMETDRLMLLQVMDMKSTMKQILQSNEKLATKLGKVDELEKSMKSVKTQIQEVSKTARCLKLQKFGVSKTNLFSAAGKQFYFTKNNVTWYKARDWCAERGMQLASPKTLSQVQEVTNQLKNRGFKANLFWLSANGIGRKRAGEFRWADGTRVDSGLWHPGSAGWSKQPDNLSSGKDLCTWLHTSFAKLGDYTCASTCYTLCQMPAALTSCLQ